MSSGGSNALLGMREAADYLSVPYGSMVKYWNHPWGIPAYRIGRGIRFRVRDLDHYVEQQRVTSKKEQ